MLLYEGLAIPGTERVREHIVHTPGDRNTKLHDGRWYGFGIHWTGGEGGADQVSKFLEDKRGLSIHIVNEPDGTIVQCADLSTYCSHIGRPGNQRFIGQETSCRGFASKADWEKASAADPTLRERSQLDWDAPRDVYTDKIDGHTVNFAAFNPAQVENTVWLATVLADYFRFPKLIPFAAISDEAAKKWTAPFPGYAELIISSGGRKYVPLFDRDTNPHGRAATWEGVLGHFHVHENKCDPGTQIMYALWCAGFNPAAKVIKGVVGD